MIESFVQAATILIVEDGAVAPRTRVYLRGVNDAKFRRPVVPGDRLRVEVSLGRRRGALALARASARIDDQIVAECELLLGLAVDGAEIHPTAIVDPSAEVGEGTTIGPHAVIGAHVRIGAGCSVGASAVAVERAVQPVPSDVTDVLDEALAEALAEAEPFDDWATIGPASAPALPAAAGLATSSGTARAAQSGTSRSRTVRDMQSAIAKVMCAPLQQLDPSPCGGGSGRPASVVLTRRNLGYSRYCLCPWKPAARRNATAI